MSAPARGAAIGGVLLLFLIAAGAVIPAEWQLRLGLHWAAEHFLAFFAATLVLCFAWRRPMAVAAALLPLAMLIEAAQALTPDRTPDLATALFAAAGVASAALSADLVLTLRKRAALARSRQM